MIVSFEGKVVSDGQGPGQTDATLKADRWHGETGIDGQSKLDRSTRLQNHFSLGQSRDFLPFVQADPGLFQATVTQSQTLAFETRINIIGFIEEVHLPLVIPQHRVGMSHGP